jgi:hypothetical protein
MTTSVALCLLGGILFGFFAREAYLDWRDSCALMSEIDNREAVFNVQLAAIILDAIRSVPTGTTEPAFTSEGTNQQERKD